MLISKGSVNTLVQVTNDVDAATRRLQFADGDSLLLNQSDGGERQPQGAQRGGPVDKATTPA